MDVKVQFNLNGSGVFTPPEDRLPALKDWYSKRIFGSQIDESVLWLITELEATRQKLVEANARITKLTECTGHTYD